MIKINHMLFGVSAYVGYRHYNNIELITAPWLYLSVAVGSIFNDIDTPKSYLGRRTRPFSDIIHLTFGHRGFTHSLLFLIVSLSLFTYLDVGSQPLIMGFIFGMSTHVFADFLTKEGVPLFWPLTEKYKSPIALKTGGIIEHLLVLLFALATFYMVNDMELPFMA